MRYLPHTENDIQQMLETIGVDRIEDLFSGVPSSCRLSRPLDIAPAAAESELVARLQELSGRNAGVSDWDAFLGGGAYNHFIPAVVDHLVSRSEFYTAYTPYQPEISQGTLQAIFEFQTMICQLTGMDIANASMYDGASACAEAVLLALRCARKRHKVLLSSALHPHYRETVRTYCRYLQVQIEEFPYTESFASDLQALTGQLDDQVAAVVVGYPNYFGRVEDLARLAELAHGQGARLIAAVAEPLALALFKSPGELGADVVVGEGQSFGIPLSYGGPGIGFFAVRNQDMRAMPGRLVGETVDQDGKRGYVLTLATREQHIRRERATSNICSNQGMCTLIVGIYLALHGKQGLRRLAEQNYAKAAYARQQIGQLEGFQVMQGESFNEFVVTCSEPAAELRARLQQVKILAGIPLVSDYPEQQKGLLVCVTEQNSREQIDRLVTALAGGAV
ncbi:MAG: aminomethyl-transferring glycine dehydrogenase subunit GcvPA [Desulfuromonadales bacterium]|nr:aminomethyl-transferring glycine dehydrogenase subunit GcvPA [Desulfuromonadales bacterium]